jgi:hypothetical protein
MQYAILTEKIKQKHVNYGSSWLNSHGIEESYEQLPLALRIMNKIK